MDDKFHKIFLALAERIYGDGAYCLKGDSVFYRWKMVLEGIWQDKWSEWIGRVIFSRLRHKGSLRLCLVSLCKFHGGNN